MPFIAATPGRAVVLTVTVADSAGRDTHAVHLTVQTTPPQGGREALRDLSNRPSPEILRGAAS